MAIQPTHRITHRNGSTVDVYINSLQLAQAQAGVQSYQASICIIFKTALGVSYFVNWDNLSIEDIDPPATRGRFVSRRDAMENRNGECGDNDNCGPCGDDQYKDHRDCLDGCILRFIA